MDYENGLLLGLILPFINEYDNPSCIYIFLYTLLCPTCSNSFNDFISMVIFNDSSYRIYYIRNIQYSCYTIHSWILCVAPIFQSMLIIVYMFICIPVCYFVIKGCTIMSSLYYIIFMSLIYVQLYLPHLIINILSLIPTHTRSWHVYAISNHVHIIYYIFIYETFHKLAIIVLFYLPVNVYFQSLMDTFYEYSFCLLRLNVIPLTRHYELLIILIYMYDTMTSCKYICMSTLFVYVGHILVIMSEQNLHPYKEVEPKETLKYIHVIFKITSRSQYLNILILYFKLMHRYVNVLPVIFRNCFLSIVSILKVYDIPNFKSAQVLNAIVLA